MVRTGVVVFRGAGAVARGLGGAVFDAVAVRVALRAAAVVVLVVGFGRGAALEGRAVRLGAVVARREGWVVVVVVVAVVVDV
ncbi:MAG TPA: hypothetical protein VFR88_10565, partial [Microlunatus sp.]|nr:hypothetical protein [Microlunatus sp.]